MRSCGTMPASRKKPIVRRTTTGGRVAATLAPSDTVSVVTGLDFTRSPHDVRNGTPTRPYSAQAWRRDARLNQTGVFAEANWRASADTRWVSGLRGSRSSSRSARGPSCSGAKYRCTKYCSSPTTQLTGWPANAA